MAAGAAYESPALANERRPDELTRQQPGDRLGRAGPGARRGRPPRHPPPAEGTARRDRRRRRRSVGPDRRGFRRVARRLGGGAARREGERAALRSAGRILRARARPASQVQLLRMARQARRRSPTPKPPRSPPPASAPAWPTASASSSSAAAGARSACGWPSAIRRARITALSNSHSQRAFIEGEAARRGLAQPARRHRRLQRLRQPTDALRPHRLGRDVRAPAQLAGGVSPRRRLAAARRALLHARVRASLRRPMPSSTATRATG